MKITQLFIYPVKSCAPVPVDELLFDQHGPVGDRRFLIVSPDGEFLTQRQIKEMAFIQPSLTATELILKIEGYGNECVLIPSSATGAQSMSVRVWGDEMQGIDCGDRVADWLAGWLKQPCRLVYLPSDNSRKVKEKYWLDDEGVSYSEYAGVSYADGAPLLLVHQSSLDQLSEQIGRDINQTRFRTNILVESDQAAFSELKWQTLETESGDRAYLFKPCERCVIPTRNPVSQDREADVIQALKDHCQIGGKIIFGQNMIFTGSSLKVGDKLSLLSASD